MGEPADPRSAPPLRWGVLAPGAIAQGFVGALHRHTCSRVVAVGSRSQDRARAFATRYAVPTAHGTYRALVEDPAVQAVYIASPHSEHLEHALLAIDAGKHILVEKAFARSAAEAEQVLDAARRSGVFAMEAMWTRFLPHMVAIRAIVARGDIGEPVGLIADHGQNMAHHPHTHRLHNPELAGGALLDLGVYPIAFAHDLFGAPDRVSAVGSLTPTGVDGQVSMGLGFGPERQASLHTTLWATTATTAVVLGSQGRIEVAGAFYRPTSFTVVADDGGRWDHDGVVADGMQYEQAEVARRIATGEVQSPDMTWQDSLDVMRTMDAVRRLIATSEPRA